MSSALERYLAHIEGVTGYRRNLSRALVLTGAAGQPTTLEGPPAIPWGIHSAAGFAAGGIIGYKKGHAVLGALGGASVFTNVPALLKGETRNEGLWNLAQTGAGVVGALSVRDQTPFNKAFGFVLGYLAVGVARHLYGGQK